MSRSHVHILLVEDNPADTELTRLAFDEAGVANTLHVVGDGAEALDFVYQRGSHEDAPRPTLILLDLNLPGIDGREFLATAKADAGLRTIPVVVLTTSKSPRDVRAAYENHANAYLVKPVRFEEFRELIRSLEGFWFRVVQLPDELPS